MLQGKLGPICPNNKVIEPNIRLMIMVLEDLTNSMYVLLHLKLV